MPRPKRLGGALGHSVERRHRAGEKVRSRPSETGGLPGLLVPEKYEPDQSPHPDILSSVPVWARQPREPKNPDPKCFRWDETKRAFRLIRTPTRCNCRNERSLLTGDRLSCGLCDGRANPPKRFLPGPFEPTCCYCGRVGYRICPQCLRRWQRLGFYLDDEMMLRMQEALTVADRRAVRDDERDAARKKRKENRARVERRQRAAASGLGDDFAEPTAEAA
jgi:hypothetical protein